MTNWRFYDTIYTERFMRTPQENPEGYDLNSPLNYADQLKESFLIIHGSADDNVHVQNTMRMVEALIQADKQFEWMIYPDKNHGIFGGNTRKHLYTKMTNYLQQSLIYDTAQRSLRNKNNFRSPPRAVRTFFYRIMGTLFILRNACFIYSFSSC